MPRDRIGINAVFLDSARMGGAETYTRHLISGLQDLDLVEDFFVFAPRDHELRVTNPRFRIVECPIDASRRYQRMLWEQLRLPGVMGRFRLDLAHFPYGTIPYGYRGRAVVTIHDTVRFDAPSEMSPLQALRRRIIERRIVATGRHVIAASQSSAESISQHLGLAAARISPVCHGVAEAFFARPPVPLSSRRGLLWIGRPYPTKNLKVLIDACRILHQRRIGLLRLRLIGIEAEHKRRLNTLLGAAGIRQSVSLEPPVAHTALPRLLETARVFVYPSQCESFGLPVLEAMGCGTPVVCSEIPPFRELHQDCALLADPDSPEQFADALARLLGDPALWEDMSRRGRQHAAQFTWKTCARNTYAVYQNLLANSGRIPRAPSDRPAAASSRNGSPRRNAA